MYRDPNSRGIGGAVRFEKRGGKKKGETKTKISGSNIHILICNDRLLYAQNLEETTRRNNRTTSSIPQPDLCENIAKNTTLFSF